MIDLTCATQQGEVIVGRCHSVWLDPAQNGDLRVRCLKNGVFIGYPGTMPEERQLVRYPAIEQDNQSNLTL